MIDRYLHRLLLSFPPEAAHGLAFGCLDHLGSLTQRLYPPPPPRPVRVMGLEFPNPVGLAAGLDKDGKHLPALARLGFGFIEVGTVTPRPQPGNPAPRLFRLPQAQALINRMGFNNEGVDCLVARLQRQSLPPALILGINIGKNADTPLALAVEDYSYCLNRVYPYAHYVTVNLSSPNTPGLRDLQYGDPLRRLLKRLKGEQQRLAEQHQRYVPLLIKIAPDLADDDIDQVGEALLTEGFDGVIATNTTLSRAGVTQLQHGEERGGLSGAPLTARATAVTARLYQKVGEALPIIGVGGILTGADARAKGEAGAALVQLYTGLIYRGPRLIREAVMALSQPDLLPHESIPPTAARHYPTRS